MRSLPEVRDAIATFAASYACRARVLVVGDEDMASRIARAEVASDLVLVRNHWTIRSFISPIRSRMRTVNRLPRERFNLAIVHDENDLDTVREALQHGVLIAIGDAARTLRETPSAQVYEIAQNDGMVHVQRSNGAADIVVMNSRAENKLHLGCGPQAIDGWINIDNRPYPGVDRLLDLSKGLPFTNADIIYAEHFIEHLEYRDTLRLLTACRAALNDDGVLRVSTPNLDWVWRVSYNPATWATDQDAIRECFVANRAFRGWGHKFLYNRQTLEELLHTAGFANVEHLVYGESTRVELRGIERHQPYPDTPELPHMVVAEASGRMQHTPHERTVAVLAEYEAAIAVS